MQDNAPCHKAKGVLTWLGKRNVIILEWPPQSPDLNPLENLWAILFSAVKEKYDQNINSLQDLRVALKQEWERIPRAFAKSI